MNSCCHGIPNPVCFLRNIVVMFFVKVYPHQGSLNLFFTILMCLIYSRILEESVFLISNGFTCDTTVLFCVSHLVLD